MEIPFAKLHGNGNDFVVIDEYAGTVLPDDMKAEFASIYCDRRFGIGADGILYLSRSGDTGIGMRILQPDGSEAEMCGNGIRCIAKFAFDAGYVKEKFSVATIAGGIPVSAGYRDEEFFASVTMPSPKFDRKEIPATGKGDYKERIGAFDVYAANTGVPHAVVFVKSVEDLDVTALAPPIRHHATFTNGANVNFVEKTGKDQFRIRTFERGVEDETLSCGTGATAVAAVANHLGMAGEVVNIETEGGPLVITLKNGALMEGPAVTVYGGLVAF